MRTRTGDPDRNEIRRCLNQRSNTIERFSHQPVPGRGFGVRTTRFLAEPSDSAIALSWDIIVKLRPNAIPGERLVASEVEEVWDCLLSAFNSGS